ncbi:MAG: adenylosuccinate lyase [Flavobacteriaceae bacterium]|nr:adenylosuccinate lyase [Flavobacteriaceae bacterium]|tara:strand:- start:16001 stop:17338 length:1338 start_codon:yes stop_codon:yes gene_type:complete
MSSFNLNAISPVDGRYSKQTELLSNYFSEKALIKYRVKVEIEYFISLTEIGIKNLNHWNNKFNDKIRKIYIEFHDEDALDVKEIEKTTNHDVKAVEYFIKRKFDEMKISEFSEFIHFGLTSQDINNTSIPLSIKDFIPKYFEKINLVLSEIDDKVEEYSNIPMLARTHGQPASPTRLGKEFKVFSVRIKEQLNVLKKIPHSCKFGGATGNFNAHQVAYPDINWKNFAENFTKKLGLDHSFPTTQIEHYDNLARLMDCLKRINTIMLDFNKDVWQYISLDYFNQKINKSEVGSSAMPHKVNPIDFENSEGNLSYANSIFEFLSSKLPISRLQRDLTDSTVLRNIGVPFSHTIIGFNSTLKGLKKLLVNKNKIENDLRDNWIVISEAIQTILRREGIEKPYELLKDFTRNNEIVNEETFIIFINNLKVDQKIKKELLNISPFNYTGI